MKDGAGRIGDGLEVRAVAIDDGRDDPVPQMDDECGAGRGPRSPRGRSGKVLLPSETVSPMMTNLRSRPSFGPRWPARLRDSSGRRPQPLGSRDELLVLAEPGQVIPAVVDRIGATARDQGRKKRHQKESFLDIDLSYLSSSIIADAQNPALRFPWDRSSRPQGMLKQGQRRETSS